MVSAAFSVIGTPASIQNHGGTFTAHLLPERKLEGEPAGIGVEEIQGDTDARRRNVGLDLRGFGTGAAEL